MLRWVALVLWSVAVFNWGAALGMWPELDPKARRGAVHLGLLLAALAGFFATIPSR